MKHNIFLILLLMVISTVWGQNPNQIYEEYDLGYDYFEFENTSIHYENITGLVVGKYFYPKNLDFEVKKDFPFLLAENTQNKKDALILKNDDLCIVYYDDENRNIDKPFFIGISKKTNKLILDGQSIKSSGNFVEKEKTYSPDKLFSLTLNYPWVENDLEYGIGEYLEFDLAGFLGEKYLPATGFYVVNGFVSISNQTLYEKNSRIKTLKIIDLETNEEWIQELEDTPNPQFIDCAGHEGNKIQIVIEDVYFGTLWKDTCISGIILAK